LQALPEQVNLANVKERTMAAKSRKRRDALAWACFAVHLAALAFIVLGWRSPWRGGLVFYLGFLPAMVLQWKLNRDTCLLNNLENWLRHGRWRAPEQNEEEGAWLRTLIRDVAGIRLSTGQMNLVIYGAIALFWALAWWRFLAFQGA
jgi:hypothetical protein